MDGTWKCFVLVKTVRKFSAREKNKKFNGNLLYRFIVFFYLILFYFIDMTSPGWFARDPSTLTLVGHVLLPSPTEATQQPTHIIIPEDCFQVLGSPSDQLSQILTGSLENMYGSKCLFCSLFI